MLQNWPLILRFGGDSINLLPVAFLLGNCKIVIRVETMIWNIVEKRNTRKS